MMSEDTAPSDWTKGDIDLLSITSKVSKDEIDPEDLNSLSTLIFDPANIVSGKPIYIRKKMSYTGYAATAYSVEQAIAIIDYIGVSTFSEDSLPYAITLMEGGELIAVAEDNGEFSCGNILGSCLQKLEGYNVLVCVSRKVDDCYIPDMVQSQKYRVIRDAATSAIEALVDRLNAKSEDLEFFDIKSLMPSHI